MKKIVVMQLLVLLVVSLICLLFAGSRGFWSALAGGLCYVIPSFAAVLLLNILKKYPELSAKGFFIGVSLKVMLSIILMLMVFVLWQNSLAFIPFVSGLFVVSQLIFMVFLRVKHYGK